MKKAIVAELSFFSNDINQTVVEVDDCATWKEAYLKTPRSIDGDVEGFVDWVNSMPDDLEEAKILFFDGELAVSVVFIDCGDKS